MDKKELNFIAETEWKQYLESRADPKNKKGYDFDDRVYADLNTLGYNIQWGFSLQPTVFNGDERIFPIVKKYVSFLEETHYCKDYIGTVSLLVHCLAHKKSTFATNWLLEKYRMAVKDNVFFELTDSYADTLCRIKDKRYINEYINLCQREYLCSSASFFVELLGVLKVQEAEDLLIKLIDYRAKPNCMMSDEYFYGMGYDVVVSETAIKSLGKLRSKKALPVIEKYLQPELLKDFSNQYRTNNYTTMKNIAKKSIQQINCNDN